MYSVQDERLDLLKRKSSSVYIVESDNDSFFGCVIQAHKQFSQMVEMFFFPRCCYCTDRGKEKSKMEADISNHIKGILRLLGRENYHSLK